MVEPAAAGEQRRTVHVERVMGTVESFVLRGGGDHDDAIHEAVAWLQAVDRRFGTYRADSEVSRFRRGEVVGHASDDLAEVMAACDAVTAASQGAVDAHLAGGCDPSGYVKGWSIGRAAAILRTHGCDEWSINAGGDVLVTVTDTAAAPWRIGIQHLFDRAALATVLQAHDLAIATSGRYGRGDRIEDPRHGVPAAAAASVTVCGPRLGLAEAFATAASVLGEGGRPGCRDSTAPSAGPAARRPDRRDGGLPDARPRVPVRYDGGPSAGHHRVTAAHGGMPVCRPPAAGTSVDVRPDE